MTSAFWLLLVPAWAHAEPTTVAVRPEPAVVETTLQPIDPPPARDAVALAALLARVDEEVARRLAAQPQTAGWRDGFYLQTADGKTKLKIGGTIQFDGRFFVADTADPHTDQFGFRSIRPDLQGTLNQYLDVRLLPDFAGARVVLQDVYADLHPFGDAVHVRVGKFKVPFGLERLQGETHTLFAERGLPAQLAPNRDLGIQLHGELARGVVAYQLGVFNGVPDGGSGDGDVSDGKEGAARIYLKPFARSQHRALAELGFGGAVTYGSKRGVLASPDLAVLRTAALTTFFTFITGPSLMDTVIADGTHWRATGQAAYYAGPVGFLGEYIRTTEKVSLGDTHGTAAFDSWQAQAQYVLTGDDATFTSVTPRHPFDPAKGQWGAVDIGARVGELRVVDGDVFREHFADGHTSALRAWSAGGAVDWYANKNLRVALNFEHTWFRYGAKGGPAATAIDRPAESSIVGRVQTVF